MSGQVRPIRWQYIKDGRDISGDMYAEDDADQARAWAGAHGDLCELVLRKSPRGKWAIEPADGFAPPLSWERKRFASPQAGADHITEKTGVAYPEAVCRCGTPGAECD